MSEQQTIAPTPEGQMQDPAIMEPSLSERPRSAEPDTMVQDIDKAHVMAVSGDFHETRAANLRTTATEAIGRLGAGRLSKVEETQVGGFLRDMSRPVSSDEARIKIAEEATRLAARHQTNAGEVEQDAAERYDAGQELLAKIQSKAGR